jgi:RNA polymerase sigma factor (sigma-70 family)
MASAAMQRALRQDVKRCVADLPDEELLGRFLHGEDLQSQEAFRALVVRHGPMVLGICRHVLSEHHDAEDAFQATFLVLAQKGGSIRNRQVLAGWLHEVAHRIAIKARVSGVRRRTLERQGLAMSPLAIVPNDQDEEAAWKELRPVLHDEVERLPDKYRLPVILSYLEGKTNEEVAEFLQWPVGTVKGRLSRARDLLRSRLKRRGLVLSAAFLVTALSEGRVFAEVVPAELIKSTVDLARKFGPRALAAGATSGSAATGATTGSPALPHAVLDPVRSTRGLSRLAAKLGIRPMTWFLFIALVATISIGLGVVAANGGGFSRVRSALTTLAPARFTGFDVPCHPSR